MHSEDSVCGDRTAPKHLEKRTLKYAMLQISTKFFHKHLRESPKQASIIKRIGEFHSNGIHGGTCTCFRSRWRGHAFTWMWDEVHVRPGAVVSPGLASGLLSMVLARRPLLWDAPPGAAPSLLTAPLHAVPTLVLH